MEDNFFAQWANFLVNLAGRALSQRVHACWVWKWKLCYLESRKSVSCSLWSKSLLLLGLLIPHGAAVFNTHSNNPSLLFSDTRLSFICASCLSFVSHPPAVAGQTPPLHSPSVFYPRTVAAPRGDVSAKRNHVRDHKISVLWQAKAQSTRNSMFVCKRDGNHLFVYMNECVHMYKDSFKNSPID